MYHEHTLLHDFAKLLMIFIPIFILLFFVGELTIAQEVPMNQKLIAHLLFALPTSILACL